MAVVSIRLDEDQAGEVGFWAERLGIAPSELVRDALSRDLIGLRVDGDVAAWANKPLSAQESSLRSVADWGPGEDWSDWKEHVDEAQSVTDPVVPDRRLGGNRSGIGVKMTIFLPEVLKKAVEEEARRRVLAEAEVIRYAIADTFGRRRPRGGLYEGEPIADDADQLLGGLGER